MGNKRQKRLAAVLAGLCLTASAAAAWAGRYISGNYQQEAGKRTAEQEEAGKRTAEQEEAGKRTAEQGEAGKKTAEQQEAGKTDGDDRKVLSVTQLSDFFRQAAENIWGRKNLTGAEYASLTSLKISREERTVSYQLDHGYVQTMSYGEEMHIDLADLAVFTGLEWLSVDMPLEKGDLEGLESLFGVYADNPLEELAEIIPLPGKITEIGTKDRSGKKTLEALEAFPGLRYLSVDYGELEDISALLQFPGLQGLILETGNHLEDYGPLGQLTGLEWLRIKGRGLEKLDFLRGMKSLSSLSIEGSGVTDLEALDECGGIAFLSLIDNPGLEDYSVLGELQGLEELVLERAQGGKLPPFGKTDSLERLSVRGAWDLSGLKEALPFPGGLRSLEIHGISTEVDSLEALTQLSELSALILEDLRVDRGMEAIFAMPSLRVLHLDHCRFGVDMGRLPINEKLEILSLNGSTLEDTGQGTEISLSEHGELLGCFPGLRELYLESMGLDNVEFAVSLPLLEHLDVRGNDIASLAPLKGLKGIRTVWYGDGTVLFP